MMATMSMQLGPLAHVAILHGLVWLLVGSMYVAFAKQLHEILENIFFINPMPVSFVLYLRVLFFENVDLAAMVSQIFV